MADVLDGRPLMENELCRVLVTLRENDLSHRPGFGLSMISSIATRVAVRSLLGENQSGPRPVSGRRGPGG